MCETPLEAVCAVCRELGAEIRSFPEERYFTATVWDGWDQADPKEPALAIQRQIKEKTAQYANLVCYCFDPFSTLVYAL